MPGKLVVVQRGQGGGRRRRRILLVKIRAWVLCCCHLLLIAIKGDEEIPGTRIDILKGGVKQVERNVHKNWAI